MHDGSNETTSRATTTWGEWIESEERVLRGEAKCEECDGTGRFERNGRRGRCSECLGRGYPLPTSTEENEAGSLDLLNGLTNLAGAVACVTVERTALPERSRALLDELQGGLGALLVEIMSRVEDLEQDVRRARGAK